MSGNYITNLETLYSRPSRSMDGQIDPPSSQSSKGSTHFFQPAFAEDEEAAASDWTFPPKIYIRACTVYAHVYIMRPHHRHHNQGLFALPTSSRSPAGRLTCKSGCHKIPGQTECPAFQCTGQRAIIKGKDRGVATLSNFAFIVTIAQSLPSLLQFDFDVL